MKKLRLSQPTPVQPRSDVLARRLGDGGVLVHLPTNRIFEVNDTGMRVWELMSTGCDASAIARTLEQEFDVDPATCARDVQRFLDEFQAAGLLA